MSSVLAMDSFKKDFGLPQSSSGFASDKNAQISSNVVSLLTAGCFFGSIFAAYINDRIGRRYSLMIFCSIFLVGAAIQVGAHHQIGMIYGGRVIAGLGIGGMSSITPVFVSENCPPEYRGRIAGMFQEFLVIGSTFAYWLDYGVKLHIPESTRQWRIPVAIQLVPGGLMLIGLFFLKESPRWLMKQGRQDEALTSLAYIRNEPQDSEEVQREIAEIYTAVEEETLATEGVTWKECLEKSNRYRFFLAFVIMFWQQFSGTNSIGYYAPQIFESIGVSSTNSSMFATGIYGTVKVVATAIFLFIGIDRWGRKNSMIGGGAWMAAMMFIIGAVLATNPPNADATSVSPASTAMVAMIYLYVIGYSFSWGPTPWVYLGEVRSQTISILEISTNFLRSSPPGCVHTVLALVLPPSGFLTLLSLRLPRVPSTRLAGEPSSCSVSSVPLCRSLLLSLSRRLRAGLWRRWTLSLVLLTRCSAAQISSRHSTRATFLTQSTSRNRQTSR